MMISFKRLCALQTIGSVLDENKGIGRGFDYLRIGLALAIFSVHAGAVSSGRGGAGDVRLAAVDVATTTVGSNTLYQALYIALVPMFFALSGFLVTGSAFRLKDVRTFLIFRSLRIFPALAVETLLSAIVLGPFFSTHKIKEYFSDPLFWSYLENMIGVVRFNLPGVFENNPLPKIVNNNLWTLPSELHCYIIMSLCIISGIVFNRQITTVLVLLLTIVLFGFSVANGLGVKQGILQGHVVTYYFFVGCLVYHWRAYIPLRLYLIAAAGVLSLAMLTQPKLVYVVPAILTYFTIGIGVLKLPESEFIKKTDYSYGIYLYSFPISQAAVAALPWLHDNRQGTRLVAGVLTILFAVLSWHVLEKPALGLKRYFLRSRPSRDVAPSELKST